MDPNALPTPVEWVQQLVEDRLQPGAWAVDATAGNGNDTALLARLVGSGGRVFSFDIQLAAIETTRALLSQHGLLDRCALIHDSHARMAELLPREAKGRIAAAMFNLGWLPWHDKHCITRADSTLAALRDCVALLAPGGLVTIVAYPNHAGGAEEAAAVSEWVSTLSAKTFEGRHLRSHYRPGRSPECWAIRKRP